MDSCVGLLEDQDISGIGVRTAFYAQSFLTVVAVAFPLAETPNITSAFWTLTLTTLALLVSAIGELSRGKLSLYNAILVTYLTVLHTLASYIVTCFHRDVVLIYQHLRSKRGNRSTVDSPFHLDWKLSVAMIMTMYLQSIAVCAFGIYVWVKAVQFGSQKECNRDTVFLFFGKSYSAIEMGRLIGLVSLGMFAALTVLLPFPIFLGEIFIMRLRPRLARLYRPSVYTIFFFGWLYIVVSIEITIRRNPVLRGSTEWPFGQIFPLVSILIPMTTVYYSAMNYREQRREQRLNEIELRSYRESPIPPPIIDESIIDSVVE